MERGHSPDMTVPAGYTVGITSLDSFSCIFLYFKADFYFHVHQFSAVSELREPCSPRGAASLQIYGGWLCVSEKLLVAVKRASETKCFGPFIWLQGLHYWRVKRQRVSALGGLQSGHCCYTESVLHLLL